MEVSYPKFEVGQRVIFVAEVDPDRGLYKGQTGVVCRSNEYDRVSVCWDKMNPRYHDCGGDCDNWHGWNVPARMLELIIESYELDIAPEDINGLLGCL